MDSIRRQEIKSWLAYLGCLGVGAALVWFLRWRLGYKLGEIGTLAVIVAPLVVYFLIDGLMAKRSKAGATTELLMDYADFARDEDALIAPNQPESSAAIAGFVGSYLSRHPNNQVYAVVAPDEPHLTATIFLIGEPLSPTEQAKLRQWKADDVSEVSAQALKPFKRTRAAPGTITRVIWD